ncbi:MAG: hypothetical protein LBE56_10220 [Tannerella sp.]|nr:hypothetical protein [Tannerella sp.]
MMRNQLYCTTLRSADEAASLKTIQSMSYPESGSVTIFTIRRLCRPTATAPDSVRIHILFIT